MDPSHFDVTQLWLRTEVGFRNDDNDSWTPLQNASHHGDLHKVQYLISRGEDLENADDSGWTPLHFASSNGHLHVVKFLISKGADVEKRDVNGITSLHMASYNGHLEVVQFLACEGADLEKADKNGSTPLHYASYNGYLEVTQYLIGEGADLGKADDKGMTPLYKSSYNGHLDVVQFLSSEGADLEKANDNGSTPLHEASYYGHFDVVQLLVSEGSHLDKADNNGSTPLHKTSYSGHLEVVQYLTVEGADIDKADNNGSTPLHKASYNGHLEVVQYLTAEGADIGKADNNGSTPLHKASYNGHLDVVQFLTGEGADLHEADNNGRTPLQYASFSGHLDVVQHLVSKGADVEKAQNNGSTPLHKASNNGHLEVVQYLTGEGADLEKADSDGGTPIHEASYNGHLEVVQFLTSEGADVEKGDSNGSTPLQKASYSGHLEIVKYLVKNGADLNKLDNDGRTPLSLASDQGHLDVVKYLRFKQRQNDNEQDGRSIKKSGQTKEQVDPELNKHSDSTSDLEKIFEQSSFGAGASIGESIQRVIRLEKYQIEVQVPPSEPWGVENITVRAITEVPSQLLDVLQENEAIICVGLEMTPSDAKFSTPVKVTMPHSAIFKRLHTASVGTYHRKNSSDSFSLITFTHGDPRCDVRERDLDLYIDHFSEWWMIAFITKTFFGKRVICTPFVPESNPRNAEHRLRLCIRDNNIGKAEPEPGYLAPVKGEEFFIAWRSGELKVTCIADNKHMGIKRRKKKLFRKSLEVNIPFVVNTANTDKSRVFVQFILEQSALIDIICPISFTDGRFEASSYSDSLHSQSFQSHTPETHGRNDSPGHSRDQVSPSGLPDPTPEVATRSPADSQEVTDVHLLSLSRELFPGHFSALYVALGIPAGIAESIRVEKMNNYPETYMQLLQLWKAESRRTLVDLDQVKAKAKGRTLQKVESLKYTTPSWC